MIKLETYKKIFTVTINFIKNNILVVGTLFAVIFCLFFYLSALNYGKESSKNFSTKKESIIIKDTTINNKIYIYLYDIDNKTVMVVNPKKSDDVYLFTRIVSQLKVVKQRAHSHSKATDYFIINLYYFIIIQTIFMIFVSVCGLIISRTGWGDSSDKLLATFLISASFLLFFQILPKGMKFEENLASNRSHYIMYCDMENRILSYLSNDNVDVNFINNIDDQLKNYHSVSFDVQQVPFSEVQRQFKEIKGSSESDRQNYKTNGEYDIKPINNKNIRKDEPVKLEMIMPPNLDTNITINDSLDKIN